MRNALRTTVRSVSLVAALAALTAGTALATNSISVPNGIHGGTCGGGNPNSARFTSNCGAQVTLTPGDTTPAYVQDNSPASEVEYRVRFYINGRGLITGTGATNHHPNTSNLTGAMTIFAAYDDEPAAGSPSAHNDVIRVELQGGAGGGGVPFDGGGSILHVYYRDNANSNAETEVTLSPTNFLPGGWRCIELHWKQGAGNGILQVQMDSTVVFNSKTLNINATISSVRWGAVAIGATGVSTNSTLLLDDFASQRQGYIGAAAPFTDMPTTDTHFPFVQAAYAASVLPDSGTIGTFGTGTGVTRGAMAKAILRARYGGSFIPPTCPGAVGVQVFDDVSCSATDADWIYEMFNEGITTGETNGCGGSPTAGCAHYGVNDQVTRGQMMVFMYAGRALNFTAGGPSHYCTSNHQDGNVSSPTFPASPFGDVHDNDTFCPYIAQAQHQGFAAGCGSGNFCASSPQLKEDMAVFLASIYVAYSNRELRAQSAGVEFP